MQTDRKESDAYIRIIEILNDYWLSVPDELKVRVTMDFVKVTGETQTKQICWYNPRYEYTGADPGGFVRLADMTPEYFRQKEKDFWSVDNYKLK